MKLRFRLEDRLEDSGFERKSTSLYVAEMQKVAGILGYMGDFLLKLICVWNIRNDKNIILK